MRAGFPNDLDFYIMIEPQRRMAARRWSAWPAAYFYGPFPYGTPLTRVCTASRTGNTASKASRDARAEARIKQLRRYSFEVQEEFSSSTGFLSPSRLTKWHSHLNIRQTLIITLTV